MDDSLEKIKRLDTEKLLDVVKNYQQYGYSEHIRVQALTELQERGITQEYIKLTGNDSNAMYGAAKDVYISFQVNSWIAFILYLMILASMLIPSFFSIGVLPLWLFYAKITAYIFYFIFIIKSFLIQRDFYEIIGETYKVEGALLYLLAGMPFYVFMFFYFQQEMAEK